MKEYKYKAFISYRHIEPDMQAAEKLQKLLESYKPPRNLTDKRESWRIFRDVSELQSSSDLSEDISNALEDSEYLIMICSPAYNQSKWCMQELMRFRELHGNTNENIITLLVDGEPDKAFPELLRFTEMKSVDESGKETTVKVEVEPLAANIRADSIKESMKKLNTEYLRIAAPLIGCDFNDLYQREKKREAQRRMRIFGSAFAVLAVITVISAVSAVTIKKKNGEIEEKNDKIEEQFDKIEEQYSEIQKQYNELIVENAEHLSTESVLLYKNNSFIPAIQKALEALPAKDGEKPAIPEAQLALSRELEMFSSDSMLPRYALKHDYAIEKLSFMGGGKSIVSQDSSGIYFWNAEDGALIKKIAYSDPEFAAEGSLAFTTIIEPDTDKTGTALKLVGPTSRFSTSTIFNVLSDCYNHNVTDEEPGTGGDVFVYNNGSVWRLNGADGEIIWRNDLSSDKDTFKNMVFDGENFLRIYERSKDGALTGDAAGTIMLDIISTDGKVIKSLDLSPAGFSSFNTSRSIKAFRDNILYVSNDHLADKDPDSISAYEEKDGKLEKKWSFSIPEEAAQNFSNPMLFFFGGDPVVMIRNSLMIDPETIIIRLDKENAEPRWTSKIASSFSDSGKLFLYKAEDLGSKDDVLLTVDKLSYSLISFTDGKVIDTVDIDEKINNVSFSKNALFMFTTMSGTEYAVYLAPYFNDTADRMCFRLQKFGQPFALCSYSRGKYVTAADYTNTAYIQFKENNASYTAVTPDDEMRCTSVYDTDSSGSKRLASFCYPDDDNAKLYICDTASGKSVCLEDIAPLKLEWANFLSSDKLAAAITDDNYEERLYIIDTTTGKSEEVKDAGEIGSEHGVMKDGIYYCTDDFSNAALNKLSSDGKVSSITLEENASCAYTLNCAVGDKAAVFTVFKDEYSLGFYNFETGNVTNADYKFEKYGADKVLRIFSIGDKYAGVLLNSKKVVIIDTETGKLTAELKLDAISQDIISASGIGNDRFAVLSRDAKLYEADLKGLTGKVINLADTINYTETAIGRSVDIEADSFNSFPSADSSCFYAVWDNNKAWYIDSEEFKARYAIDDFALAPSEKNVVFTYDDYYGHTGFMPIYTVQQLVDTASQYLDKLGEASEEER